MTSTRTVTTRPCPTSTSPAGTRSSTGTHRGPGTPLTPSRRSASSARTGTALVPTYDIAQSRRTGTHRLDLGTSRLVVAEGIFAQEIVASCRRQGLLADAVCVTQHPAITFVRRLERDLREHRKKPLVLVRRGLRLALDQRRVVHHAVTLGCRTVHPEVAYRELAAEFLTPP